MKYLKTFENKIAKHLNVLNDLRINGIDINSNSPKFIKDNNNLPVNAKFKIGDYVRIKESPKFIYKIKHYYIINDFLESFNIFACFITIDTFGFLTSKTWVYEDDIEN